jgi:Ca2+-binding EF-hand superfamily protein
LKIRNITAALALTCLVAAPAALAQTADEAKTASVEKWFELYDRNHDQLLTVEEFSLGKTFFTALDLDRNGSVPRDEAKQALLKKNTVKTINWSPMDADKDGYVTVREWTGTAEEFDAHDLDGDRVLSSYDRALGRERNRAAGLLKVYDKDGDGLISSKEWPADVSTFRQHDRNRDGMLNVDELQEDVKRKEQ